MILCRYIKKWNKFLSKLMELISFTINQHYLSHIDLIFKNLGPLQTISGRPSLERMIGIVKKKVRSTSKPSENVANVIISHHEFCCER